MNTRLIGLALSGALLLAACGGGVPPVSPTDTTAPTITLANRQTVPLSATSVTVTGKVGDNGPVSELTAVYSVDGGLPQPLTLGSDGSFSFNVSLPSGKSGALIVVAVKDKAGNAAEANEIVTRAQVQPPEQTVAFSGSVAAQRAGAAVAGATVRVEGGSVQTTTDAQGRFALKVPVSAKVLLIEKAGYGTVRVENIDTSTPQTLEEIMPFLFDLSLPSVAPTVTLQVQTNPQEMDPAKANFAPFNDGAVVGDQNLILKATVTTASPDRNPPASGIASIGSSAGNSGYLNAGRVRSTTSVADGTGLFAFAKSSFAAFNGTVEVHVNIFDFNGNHTDVIRRVKVGGAANAAAVVAPTNVAPTAITFADTATFGALSKNPGAAQLLKQYLSSRDAKVLNALRAPAGQVTAQTGVRPQAAPQGTVLWVDVGFTYDPGAPAPRAFELYRSLDGSNYSKVLTAAPARVKVAVPAGQPDKGLYTIRDTSSLLTPGVKTYYKVRAVGDAGMQDSGVQNVTPLGRYRVELVAPGQAVTGVDRIPVFRWKTYGASDKELLSVLVFDRTEAEGKTTQYISDPVSGNALIYNADGLARTPRLQAYHAYDWQLAAVTSNAAGTAFSIAADFFNLFQVTAFPVEGGPVNEFVTGGL